MLFRLDEFMKYAKEHINDFYIPYRFWICLSSSQLTKIEKSFLGKEGLNENVIESYLKKSETNYK